MSFRLSLGYLLFSACCGIGPLSAVTTSIWEQSSQKDFEAGTLKDVSITSEGEILLARKFDRICGNKGRNLRLVPR